MKAGISILLAAAMTLCGCTADVNSENIKEKTAMIDFIPDTSNVKPLGRTYLNDDTLWLCYSGTGAEFTVSGTKAEVTLAGDSVAAMPMQDENYARIAVYVNDTRVIDEQLKQPEKTYTVFESNTAETVNVKVIKLSETAMSSIGIKSISVNDGGTVKPVSEKKLKIEFVGDSITCGYGVDDEDKEHHFSTATEDATRAYAYKTAQALNADYSLVSISGYGIISGYTANGIKSAEQVISPYYSRLGFSYGSFNGLKPQDIEWDFSFKPDIIVINLGTNDDSYCGDDEERQREFTLAYTEFIKSIRSKNPDAEIICALGIMGQRLYPWVEEAVKNYSAETGDKNIRSLMFDNQAAEDGLVADWHPTEKTHSKAAERLVTEINKTLK